jgi:molybdopterin-binding protein
MSLRQAVQELQIGGTRRPIPYGEGHNRSTTEYPMKKLSARNQLKGKIAEVKKGTTTAHVRIDIGGGVIITSAITNEAVADLNLKTGDEAWAVIKASDVMIGV